MPTSWGMQKTPHFWLLALDMGSRFVLGLGAQAKLIFLASYCIESKYVCVLIKLLSSKQQAVKMCVHVHSNPACDTDLMWFSMCKICHLVMNLGL